MTFLKIRIFSLSEGWADIVKIVVKGLFGQLYLDDVAFKVRRGLTSVVRDGRYAGGRPYGYRLTPGKPGEIEIVPEVAAVIKRIFKDYANGISPRAIAGRLNAESIPAPRGKTWNASTINGNLSRGHGILLNPIYGGKIVWNKVKMVKKPGSNRRISQPNPEQEWITVEAKHLQIVDDETFEKVATLKKQLSKEPRSIRASRNHRILSGLLKCGCCGGGMTSEGRTDGRIRIRCSRHRESGTCHNGRKPYLDLIEKAVLGGLQTQLQNPALIQQYIDAYHAERRRLRGQQAAQQTHDDRRLKEGQDPDQQPRRCARLRQRQDHANRGAAGIAPSRAGQA